MSLTAVALEAGDVDDDREVEVDDDDEEDDEEDDDLSAELLDRDVVLFEEVLLPAPLMLMRKD